MIEENKILYELVSNGIYKSGGHNGFTVTMSRYKYTVSFITILAEEAKKTFPIHCMGFCSLVDYLETHFIVHERSIL